MATPSPRITPYRGFWDSPVVSLTAYAHVVGEVIVPLYPRAMTPLSIVSMGYFVMKAIDRGGKAALLEPAFEMQRFAASRAAFDVGLTGWLSCITFPSLVLGATVGPISSLLQANSVQWKLPPQVVRFAPVVAGAVLLPVVLPSSAWAAEAVMAWAVRPFIELAKPVARGPRSDYEAPSPEALLAGGAGALPGLELSDEDSRRLRWALDGNPESAFPDDDSSSGASASATDGVAATGSTASTGIPAPRSSRRRAGGQAPAELRGPAEEDAAFVAALAEYTARHSATTTAITALQAGGSAPTKPSDAPSSDQDSDYDRALAAALEAASSKRKRFQSAPTPPPSHESGAHDAPAVR